jgi:anti-anti-sigma factor
MNIKIVKPVGKLDVSASTEFRREINSIVTANCPKFLVIDLELVTFMDSSGLGALVSALKAVRGGNGELVICGIAEQIKMLFDLTSMGKIFSVYPSVAAFKQQMNLID